MNNAVNIAAMSATLSAANSARRAEEARERRLRNKGNDEIYFITNKSIDNVGERIAKKYGNWYYKDGAIYETHPNFSIGTFFMALFIGGSVAWILLMLGAVVYTSITNNWDLDFPMNTNGVIVSAIIGLFLGILLGLLFGGDSEVDYVSLTKEGNKTRVLLTVYDSNGYRNFHEDEIHNILSEFSEDE